MTVFSPTATRLPVQMSAPLAGRSTPFVTTMGDSLSSQLKTARRAMLPERASQKRGNGFTNMSSGRAALVTRGKSLPSAPIPFPFAKSFPGLARPNGQWEISAGIQLAGAHGNLAFTYGPYVPASSLLGSTEHSAKTSATTTTTKAKK